MPRGGKRPGSGKPKGHKAKNTLAAEQARAALIQCIHDDMQELYTAWKATAVGHTVERKVFGKKVIYDVSPNPNAIRDMLDRAMGKPVQPVEGKLDTSVDLSERAQAILAKLNALDENQGRQDGDDVDGGDSEDSG